MAVTTNEWLPASGEKPWMKRNVLVRLSDNTYDVAYWCGLYWSTQSGKPYHNDGAEITHFYIFEKFNENTQEL